MDEYRRTNTTVSLLYYHFVFCPRYRRKILLQGRTFSYSDTQRYRVGTNYLQLPINAPKKHVATNQRDGQMEYKVDIGKGQNSHVNYEPSTLGGLKEAENLGKEHTPYVEGELKRESIVRTNNLERRIVDFLTVSVTSLSKI